MSRTAAGPSKKTGLLEDKDPTATYIVPGHIFGGGPEYTHEKIGRERAERQRKKRQGKEVEEQLNKSLDKKQKLDNRAKYLPPISLLGNKRQAAPSKVIVTVSFLVSDTTKITVLHSLLA